MELSEEYTCKKSCHSRRYKSPSHQACHPHRVPWNSKITNMYFFTIKASWHFLVAFYAMVYVLAWMRHTSWKTAVQLFRITFQLNNESWDFSPSSASKWSSCPYKKEKHVMSSTRIVTNSEYLCASFILIFFVPNRSLTRKGETCLWKVCNTLSPVKWPQLRIMESNNYGGNWSKKPVNA